MCVLKCKLRLMNTREWLITNNPTNLITVLINKLFGQIVWPKTKLHWQNMELLENVRCLTAISTPVTFLYPLVGCIAKVAARTTDLLNAALEQKKSQQGEIEQKAHRITKLEASLKISSQDVKKVFVCVLLGEECVWYWGRSVYVWVWQ